MLRCLKQVQFDVLCGVPYTALPIATIMSAETKVPMVMRRKEAKAYGTKQTIEGVFRKDQTCLVVEDLVTSGISVFETVVPLQEVGLKVHDVVVLVDRQQGGRQNLQKRGLNLHAVFTISDILTVLRNANRLDEKLHEKVLQFIRDSQVSVQPSGAGVVQSKPDARSAAAMTYGERAALCQNAVARTLLSLMHRKQTNLCVSADVSTCAELLRLADAVGPFICLLKTHVDILPDFSDAFLKKLIELAKKHGFLIFEDRKFADIGNTVSLQYGAGVYRIASWADIVNAHILPGPGIIDGLKQVCYSNSSVKILSTEISTDRRCGCRLPQNLPLLVDCSCWHR